MSVSWVPCAPSFRGGCDDCMPSYTCSACFHGDPMSVRGLGGLIYPDSRWGPGTQAHPHDRCSDGQATLGRKSGHSQGHNISTISGKRPTAPGGCPFAGCKHGLLRAFACRGPAENRWPGRKERGGEGGRERGRERVTPDDIVRTPASAVPGLITYLCGHPFMLKVVPT